MLRKATQKQQNPLKSNWLALSQDDTLDFDLDTHPGRYRVELANSNEVWNDDSELSDEIIVRLWLARQRALFRAFPTQV